MYCFYSFFCVIIKLGDTMKKLFIILLSLFLTGSIVSVSIVLNNKEKGKLFSSDISKTIVKKKEKCKEVNNKYKIILITNNDNKVESIETCTDCDDKELPNLTRDGFDFAGWYYDSDFKTNVNSSKIKELTKKEKKDNNCLIGYEDITVYAKWNEKPKQEEKEETSSAEEEIVDNVQIEETPALEEQKVPDEQITSESVPNVCEIKKPVEYGKYVNYAMATHSGNLNAKYNYYIVSKSRADIYSITCGEVYYIKSYTSKFNYINQEVPEKVYDIYTLFNKNGEFVSIVYLEVVEPNVHVGEIITSETKIGKMGVFSKSVFIHRLPFINIFIKKGKSEIYRTIEENVINPQQFMSLPSNEFWSER